jgi:hypothetical protein
LVGPSTPPETRYTKTDDGLSIAYQILGDGPTAIVLMLCFPSVDVMWEGPSFAHSNESSGTLALHDLAVVRALPSRWNQA